MTLGYVGLGKMGQNMVARLTKKGHRVFVYDKNSDFIKRAKSSKATPCDSLEDLVKRLPAPKIIWIMVPHKAVSNVISELKPFLEKTSTIIDGGNSPFWESRKRFKELKRFGINFLDAGISGGPKGALEGVACMVGGDKKIYQRYKQLFSDISVKNGYNYVGTSGAGHFVKMIHNGIEYGMMQSIAEGFEILKKSDYRFDLKSIAKIYANGSVIESRLIKWLLEAFGKYGENLNLVSGSVAQSGEGLWTVKTAQNMKISVPAVKSAVAFRRKSQTKPGYAGKILSAMRNQFGGHSIKK